MFAHDQPAGTGDHNENRKGEQVKPKEENQSRNNDDAHPDGQAEPQLFSGLVECLIDREWLSPLRRLHG